MAVETISAQHPSKLFLSLSLSLSLSRTLSLSLSLSLFHPMSACCCRVVLVLSAIYDEFR
jgi:hypothetical protein